jgi:hypothetical protein
MIITARRLILEQRAGGHIGHVSTIVLIAGVPLVPVFVASGIASFPAA